MPRIGRISRLEARPISVKKDLAVDDFARRLRNQTHDGLGGNTFAAAGLADNTEHLALRGKRNIIHRLGSALKGVEIGLEDPLPSEDDPVLS